jgi:hypothetical protein
LKEELEQLNLIDAEILKLTFESLSDDEWCALKKMNGERTHWGAGSLDYYYV